jgi:hypothetical protein
LFPVAFFAVCTGIDASRLSAADLIRHPVHSIHRF